MEAMLLVVVGAYAMTSLILHHFPSLLHKRKRVNFQAFHISHRGGCGEAIENTMKAYRHCLEAGSEMIEIDCHMTRDGEVVVVHDNDLSDVSEKNVLVSLTPYSELPLYKTEVPVVFKRNCRMMVNPDEDRKIPLLKEIFENFQQLPINIDIKVDSDELIKKVGELIKEYNRREITVWGAFSSQISDKCYREDPTVPLFCSFGRIMRMVGCFYVGLLPFLPIRETFFEIAMPSIAFGKNGFRNFGLLGNISLRVIDFLFMNRSLFRHLQRRGMKVYVWVLNDEEQFDRAIGYGVDGVMTDFPSKLTAYLKENKPMSS